MKQRKVRPVRLNRRDLRRLRMRDATRGGGQIPRDKQGFILTEPEK